MDIPATVLSQGTKKMLPCEHCTLVRRCAIRFVAGLALCAHAGQCTRYNIIRSRSRTPRTRSELVRSIFDMSVDAHAHVHKQRQQQQHQPCTSTTAAAAAATTAAAAAIFSAVRACVCVCVCPLWHHELAHNAHVLHVDCSSGAFFETGNIYLELIP